MQIDPRPQFQTYLDHIINQVYLGGETPLPKFFTTPGFTEALAKAAVELAERKVLALQRFNKRTIKKELARLRDISCRLAEICFYLVPVPISEDFNEERLASTVGEGFLDHQRDAHVR